MSGNLIIGLIIVAVIAVAILTIINDRRKGRSSCGCNCGACSKCGNNVTIEDCCKKN